MEHVTHRSRRWDLSKPGIRAHCRSCGWRAGVFTSRCLACSTPYPSLRPRLLMQTYLFVAAVAIAATAWRIVESIAHA